jgi:hypothetical protein
MKLSSSTCILSPICIEKVLKIHKKVAKIPEKSDIPFLLTYLPPLSYLVPILLDPPSPKKIGHHLCTFPYVKSIATFALTFLGYIILVLASVGNFKS